MIFFVVVALIAYSLLVLLRLLLTAIDGELHVAVLTVLLLIADATVGVVVPLDGDTMFDCWIYIW